MTVMIDAEGRIIEDTGATAATNALASVIPVANWVYTGWQVLNRLFPTGTTYYYERYAPSGWRIVPQLSANPAAYVSGGLNLPSGVLSTPGFAPGGVMPVVSVPKATLPKPTVLPGPAPTGAGPISDTTTKGSQMAITNLGSFLSTGTQDALNWLFGSGTSSPLNSPASTPATPAATSSAQTASSTPASAAQTGMILGPGQVAPSGSKRYPGTVYVDANGNVVDVRLHKTRRRRRAIMTSAQAAQLEMAKAVLGKGEAFKEWIAIRGRG